MLLSKRVQLIKPSATLALAAKTSALKAEGHDIISLVVGEPYIDTPLHIKAAGIEAIHNGITKYTPVDGLPPLKKAIISKLAKQNNLIYAKNEIIVCTGAKQALSNIMFATINPNDEVIIPAPYWPSYPDMVKLAEGKPVILPTTEDKEFKITPEQLDKAITKKTKMLIINSPNNPTGSCYSETELINIGQVLLKHPHVLVVSDEIYEHIIWDTSGYTNILNSMPKLKNRVVLVNGVSKTYSMTGWRIGYAAGPSELIKAMTTIQSQTTTNACSISQIAAIEALTGDHTCVKEMVTKFKHRHDLAITSLNKIPGIQCSSTNGSFYLFPNVAGAIKLLGLKNDSELCQVLLEKANVAITPGSEFGYPNHVRISLSTQKHNLIEAISRINDVITGD